MRHECPCGDDSCASWLECSVDMLCCLFRGVKTGDNEISEGMREKFIRECEFLSSHNGGGDGLVVSCGMCFATFDLAGIGIGAVDCDGWRGLVGHDYSGHLPCSTAVVV